MRTRCRGASVGSAVSTAHSYAPASAWSRVRAFALDYLLIAGYLVALTGVGTWMTFGPAANWWRELLSTPARMDALAFCFTVGPVSAFFAISEARGGATWGKQRVGLVVRSLDGRPLSLRQSTSRAAFMFLPWQLAHTSMLHIPGFPVAVTEVPSASLVGLVGCWSLVALYLVGLSGAAGGRPLYDRLSGSSVLRRVDANANR